MSSLISTPLEHTLAGWWNSIDDACRKAFFASVCVNILAFGFEMTNLTLHHDDVVHILIQDTILGHFLGRFGHGWFHYVLQNHYVMPFLQMAEGIILMSAYGVLVAYFWGARKSWDLALLSAIVCTFPYMAQVFQYNTTMAAYPAAHLLAALAVVLSVRATLLHSALAALLYVAAFSIYQSVAANAATIFVVWLLARQLFGAEEESLVSRSTLRATIAALISVIAGGIVYLAAVSMMNLEPDTIHSSDEAFHLRGALSPLLGLGEIVEGTQRFFRWPENYFPAYLKTLQLAAVAAALVGCLRLPRRLSGKFAAVGLLLLAMLAPRALQLLAPKGHFHNLALTAYALVTAGAVMIVLRAARTAGRNLTIVLTAILIAGYVMQCNWISTVNYAQHRSPTSRRCPRCWRACARYRTRAGTAGRSPSSERTRCPSTIRSNSRPAWRRHTWTGSTWPTWRASCARRPISWLRTSRCRPSSNTPRRIPSGQRPAV